MSRPFSGFLGWLWGWLEPTTPTPTPTPVPPPVPPPVDPAQDVSAAGLIPALNGRRAARSLPSLRDDAVLAASAMSWASAMAAAGRASHDGFPGRVESVAPGVQVGEIVAEGQTSVAEVVASWMASPRHRADILGDFGRAGGGVATSRDGVPYWCVQFAGGAA